MKNCLVVDDSSIVRKLSLRILGEIGFECREAEDGSQALDACRARMPDVILLDWNMPVMNGIECIRSLRNWPAAAGVKVIFCTTHGDMTQIHEALEAGADEYIMKPFDREIMETKLRQVGLL